MKKSKTMTEVGTFVKNKETNNYELLFTSESEILAKGRAKEEAADRNKYCNATYDLDDIILKHRTVTITEEYSEWNEE